MNTRPSRPSESGPPRGGSLRPGAGEALWFEVATPDGAPLGGEPVRAGDVAPLAAEAWREGCLRTGRGGALSELEFRIEPVPAGAEGLRLSWRHGEGEGAMPLDPATGFEPVMRRVVERCLERGLLKPGDEYLPRWTAGAPPGGAGNGVVRCGVAFRVPGRAPDCLPVRLEDLRRWAEPRGRVEAGAFPVFYPASLAGRVQSLARRGEAESVESGAALAGVLLRGTDGPELAVLLTAALPFEHADATQTRLEPTAATWAGIHAALRVRRQAMPGIPEVLVGQVHGHPFLPGDCGECSRRPDCALSTAASSAEDDQWMRLVFGTQPWALCHIVGYSPRREVVEQLFTRSGGRLRARGFHVVPDFVLGVVLPGAVLG